jgi:RNA polymerase sigma factor (sigma-70 family)
LADIFGGGYKNDGQAMHDATLLRSYAGTGSQDAFAEFVRRCLPMVYGAALRRVAGDTHLAQDVAQMVFAAVSRDAERLARHPDLMGWLFTTTRFLAAKTMRTERRRQLREQVVFHDGATDDESEGGAEGVQPVLDDVLMELRELDRQMLLLRFYRGFRLGEIAAQYNSSENAVQKRIERALERLKEQLTRRGIVSTAVALTFALEQQAAVVVPVGLASASITTGLAGGLTGVGALAAPSLLSSMKLQICAAAVLVGATSTGVVWHLREEARWRAELAEARAKVVAAAVPAPVAPLAVAAPSVAVPAQVATNAVLVNEPTSGAGARPVVASPSVAVGQNQMGVAMAQPKGKKIPLKIEYPKPLFVGTPRPISMSNLEKPSVRVVELMVPVATQLLSKGKPVSSSDSLPVIGEWSFVTDGNKSGRDGAYVELGPMLQWIQIDLGESARVHAIAVWHFHAQARVYHDVVVQVSDDKTFRSGVTTVFNNDHDNSSKLGAGKDPAYLETFRGRVIAGGGARGRYVRLYSNGNSTDALNHYCEVEVFGEPAD